jgi:1-acyl-sn-glycerol-3-phosphate acyltransferase
VPCVLARHASIADSLLTAWVVTEQGLHPRVVLKHELLSDACLDVVGNRLPNCFVDRDAEDHGPALAAIEEMAATMDDRSAAIIFPEGALASPAKRNRALERIATRDAARAARLGELAHLLPPRPSGTRALLRGARRAGAGVVLAWHTGLDGMDTFAGIVARVARPVAIRIRLVRVDEPSTLEPPEFEQWLDDRWLQLDVAIAELSVAPSRS